jgi:pimeloyl-ACP methyl ester carboxylesterase
MRKSCTGTSRFAQRLFLALAVATVCFTGRARGQEASTEEQISFATPVAEAAGSFLRPTATNKMPCVVILGGTLSQTRDGGLTEPGVPPRNALKRLADALARAGYASLRFDRVGYGASKPHAGWTGSYHQEAEVAAAAIRWAREQTNLSAVIVAGESAGAYLACLAAEAGTAADAYVFLGGFCGTSHELYDYNFGRLARYAAESPANREWATLNARRDLALGRHFESMLAAAAEGKEQFEVVDGDFQMTLGLARRREELTSPPGQMFKYIQAPALALAGKEDFNVPSEHAWRIARTIHASGNTNVASLLLSACDHSFQWLPPDHDEDVAFRERYTFESFKRGYNTNVYAAMIGWLRKVVPSPADPASPQVAKPTTPPYQRAIRGSELDLKTESSPERLQLAPGIEIINEIPDPVRLAGVDTLEGRIGPLLLGEGCQAHFIDMPAGMFTEEHPHGSESIIYTVRGQWVLCSQGRRHLMKPGTLFRFGAFISTGYEVPFGEPACILIFKGERSTDQEQDFIAYLTSMAARLEGRQKKGQEKFLLKDLPADHPAREFGQEVNPNFDPSTP